MLAEAIRGFIRVWPADKAGIKQKIKNKIPIKFVGTESHSLLVNKIPQILYSSAGIHENQYLIKGSLGNTQPADIPWFAIYDREITQSAQKGYYLVVLFKEDLSGFYLTLNQGWTQYKNRYGTKQAKQEIAKQAAIAKKLLRSTQGFSLGPIKLNSKSNLAPGYELGTICSKYYSSTSIPSDQELFDDIRNLLGVYRELKGLIGVDILKLGDDLDDESYQSSVQEGKEIVLPIGKIPVKKDNNTTTWVRDKDVAYTAIARTNFRCENNPSHETFVSAASGNPYMESHHLVPIAKQDDFDVNIDVPENIICLCPVCHRAFHSSELEYRNRLIEKFYLKRKEKLKSRGITVDIDTLKEYYNTI